MNCELNLENKNKNKNKQEDYLTIILSHIGLIEYLYFIIIL